MIMNYCTFGILYLLCIISIIHEKFHYDKKTHIDRNMREMLIYVLIEINVQFSIRLRRNIISIS